MDVSKMIADLRQERDHLNEVIVGLERLAMGQGKRRGRPPAWLSEARSEAPEAGTGGPKKKRGRPPGSKSKKVQAASEE